MTRILALAITRVRPLALATVACCTAPAAIILDVDTATRLEGSFTVSGPAGTDTLLTTAFEAFPGGGQRIDVRRTFIGGPGGLSVLFDVSGIGVPDDPNFNVVGANGLAVEVFADVAGSYANTPSSIPTTFRIFNLVDTGTSSGTFSGEFEFIGAAAAVPEPSTLALLGLSLGALLFGRRFFGH